MSDGEGFGFNYASAAVTLLPPQLDDGADRTLGSSVFVLSPAEEMDSDCDDLSAFAKRVG